MIRFVRTPEAKTAYSLYDDGLYGNVIRYCTEQLKRPGADPELQLLRGVAHLDRNCPSEAVDDWEGCCDDPQIGGVAHYYLGNFLRGQGLEYKAAAWNHYTRAVELGWVEGHIGRGFMFFDNDQPGAVEDEEDEAPRLREAVRELTLGFGSPSAHSRKRALSIRSSVWYHLGDIEACKRDKAADRALVVTEEERTGPDPRAR